MRRKSQLLYSLLFFFISSTAYAQIKKSKTWDLSVHGGIILPNTDLSQSRNSSQIGLGYSITKFILPFLALQEQLLVCKLKSDEVGNGSNSKYKFETNTIFSPSIHILLQFGNVGFLKAVPNLTIYGSAGIGIMKFSPTVFRDDSTFARNYYVQNNLIDNTVDYSETTTLTYPLAAGIKYRIRTHLSLHLEYSQRLTNTDKLDGWYQLSSGNDRFGYLNLGVTVHIGKVED